MKTIALIIMVATLIEGLIEYAKTIIKLFEQGDYKTARLQLASIVLGIGGAFVFNMQLFNIGLSDIYEVAINPTVDMILTGIVASRGANYASDFIGMLRKPKTTDGQVLAILEDGIVNEYADEDHDYIGGDEDVVN